MPRVPEGARDFLLLLGVFALLLLAFCVRPREGSARADPDRWVLGPRTQPDVVGGPPPASPAEAGAAVRPLPGGYRVVPGLAGGTVRGTCRLAAPVDLPRLPTFKDAAACGHTEHASERVVYDPTTLALAHCVVWIEGLAEGKEWPEAMRGKDRSALLDQKGCAYVPHVLAVRTRTGIRVRNSDRAEHNVRATIGGTTAFNLLQPALQSTEGKAELELRRPGIYTLACDIHPWMNGSIHAFETPYFAVTGPDGTFALDDVPEGTWTLVCWHEGMRETPQYGPTGITGYVYGMDVVRRVPVRVTAGEVTVADFVIEAP